VTTTDTTLDLEAYRRELTGYCYRMLGSGFDAEDAVQETMLRAWKAAGEFEGRASVRSWLYRIATNVCLDALRAGKRRADPIDLSAPWSADTPLPAQLPESEWVSPIADERVLPVEGDPAEVAELRDTVRLAFVAALQHLPPKQRAVLILREVLRWQATEVAELLDTSVASVNSALQRARATLDEHRPAEPVSLDDEHRALLRRYLEAFERYDVDTLVTLVSDDASFTMPPWPLWLRGPEDIGKWYLGQGIACRGSHLVPVAANGVQGYGAYKPAGEGRWEPWGIQVIEASGGRITGLYHYIDAALFPAFGLPPVLEA
jgi:RNA polymerase sigma-70 factor (ECF subfamily)